MRIYDESNHALLRAKCNQCGRDLKVVNGILMEGCFEGRHVFGFFSEKDGQVYDFDLCEHCFDQLMDGLSLPPAILPVNELL